MKIYRTKNWDQICQRPGGQDIEVEGIARAILEDVRLNGDRALKAYAKKFDSVELDGFELTTNIDVSENVLIALEAAAENVRKFHSAQKADRIDVETMPGVVCSRETRPIQKVGLYVPGGSAPLPSTVLMLAIPAFLAGCEELVLCTPPNPSREILAAAKVAGIERIYQVGGAQAIAAMAYGTETIPKVDKIFGPGNQYVTAAKMLIQTQGVAIDMPAGPSELLVIADSEARADFVASDLLSQAEHGTDSQVVLVSDNDEKINDVVKEIDKQIEDLPRQEIIRAALAGSFCLLVDDLDGALEFSNLYAPEHLILNVVDAESYVGKVKNAGSVFLGQYSCESAGDYASGTNHTLPTYGFAKSYSGVSLDSFLKKITFQKITREGAKNIGPIVEALAECEGLMAHKNAMTLRIKS